MTGIYMWTSPSGKKYVGQSEDLDARKTIFLCDKAYYAGSKLQAARKKYPDFSKWKYEVLEECELEELDDREIYWIEVHGSFYHGYNMTKGGGGARGVQISQETREKLRKAKLGAKMSEEAKKKMSKAHKGKKKSREWAEKIGQSQIGKTVSEDTKKKISAAQIKAHIERPESYLHSKETIEKIRNGNIGIIHPTLRLPIVQYSLEGEYIREWECASEAAKELGINASPITGCLKGKVKTYRGYQWKYKNDISPVCSVSERKTKPKKVVCRTTDGNVVKIYSSLCKAVKETGVCMWSIKNCIANPDKVSKGGFKWEYAS